MDVTTIGIDLAKQVFQLHGVNARGGLVVRKALRRAQVIPFFTELSPCLVGMEACGTSHPWAHELMALGHAVKMMPPAYVKAYVKRGKTDAARRAAVEPVAADRLHRLARVAVRAEGSHDLEGVAVIAHVRPGAHQHQAA